MINKEKSLMSWKMKKSLSWPNCRKMDSKICPLYMGTLSFKRCGPLNSSLVIIVMAVIIHVLLILRHKPLGIHLLVKHHALIHWAHAWRHPVRGHGHLVPEAGSTR